MKMLVIGGDLRFAYLVKQARAEGYNAAAFGLENAPLESVPDAPAEEIARAGCVIMPNPFARGPQMGLAKTPLSLDEILDMLPAGVPLMFFGPGKIPVGLYDRFAITDLNEDEALVRKNARFTAEGAICKIMERLPLAFDGLHCLVVGYGRIAQALHRMLDGLNACVTVAARREDARKQAQSGGAKAVDMGQIADAIAAQRVVFSTPPERVLGEAELLHAREGALVMDLSSPPFGVDLDAAQRLGLEAWREPGLPGRYCPQSAGIALFEAVRTALKRDGGVFRGV